MLNFYVDENILVTEETNSLRYEKMHYCRISVYVPFFVLFHMI